MHVYMEGIASGALDARELAQGGEKNWGIYWGKL